MGWTRQLPQGVQDFMDALLEDIVHRPQTYMWGLLAFVLPLTIVALVVSCLLVRELDRVERRKGASPYSLTLTVEIASLYRCLSGSGLCWRSPLAHIFRFFLLLSSAFSLLWRVSTMPAAATVKAQNQRAVQGPSTPEASTTSHASSVRKRASKT